ncbi:uncharacterized protein N7484_007402 [Penicillium longicatenatum]|uniref:uncharacterized protein n=1 Tax=Penicillium longicatenatum TaxID=1561947 RepID=UPI002549820D|nr:uncharacterized protein N7484_007402 [Penicillium longicatenatum]KAJ5639540.1 hypothetical protein N7484_007402 [Penicillium longicatenatum]
MSQPRPDCVEWNWRFHHESWDTPWSSEDFPASETEFDHLRKIRQWNIEPWFMAPRCEATTLLKQEITHRWPWGYTIYRTVYTPESDLHWEAAADAIRANIFATLDWQLKNGRRQDKHSHRLVREGYRSLVFEDKARFDGATISQIREHFKASVNNEPAPLGNRFRWCLVIDQEALQSFIRHPEPAGTYIQDEPDAKEKNGAWVTVVDPDWKATNEYSERFYPGFMRIHLNRLFRLAYNGDVMPMSHMSTDMDSPEDIPWFNDF